MRMSSPGLGWLVARRIMAGTLVGLAVADEIASLACMRGNSMEPTLTSGGNTVFGFLTGDLLLLDKLPVHDFSFSRGDVVVFRSPEEPKVWMVKRVTAMQGDMVSLPGRRDLMQVPRGHCWVEGDNASVSLDSRQLGPIPIGLLKARVTYVVWPPPRFGAVRRSHARV